MNKASKTRSNCHYYHVRALPVDLEEYNQSKKLPFRIRFRALLYLNTRHTLAEPIPCQTMYYFDSAFVHSCIGTPPHPPSNFPLLLFLASTVVWIGQLLSASVLCHLVMKRPSASTTLLYQFPFFLAALDHSTLFTPDSWS